MTVLDSWLGAIAQENNLMLKNQITVFYSDRLLRNLFELLWIESGKLVKSDLFKKTKSIVEYISIALEENAFDIDVNMQLFLRAYKDLSVAVSLANELEKQKILWQKFQPILQKKLISKIAQRIKKISGWGNNEKFVSGISFFSFSSVKNQIEKRVKVFNKELLEYGHVLNQFNSIVDKSLLYYQSLTDYEKQQSPAVMQLDNIYRMYAGLIEQWQTYLSSAFKEQYNFSSTNAIVLQQLRTDYFELIQTQMQLLSNISTKLGLQEKSQNFLELLNKIQTMIVQENGAFFIKAP